MKRKYKKRKLTSQTKSSKSDNEQIRSGIDGKFVTVDLTRFSRIYRNDILVCGNEVNLSDANIKNSVVIKNLSEIVESSCLEEAKQELSTNQFISGWEVFNVKTNNKLWIPKTVWERFVETKL